MFEMEKLKNIEILRFLLILAVVICHLKEMFIMFGNDIPVYQTLLKNVNWAWLSVDCFFMISGFFMFLKTDFTQKFFDFAKKKLMRFMPTVVYVLLLWLVLSFFTPLSYDKYNNVFILLNLQNVGLTYRTGNIGASWFLSSLFWTMCFYFYLYKIIDKKWFNLITACTIFFCYSFFNHCHVKHFENEAFVFNVGMLRAFAGIGVGYFLSMCYKDNIDIIKAKVLNIWQKLLITGAEIYILAFTFYHLCFHKMSYNNKMIMILAFIGLLGLFFIKKVIFPNS